MNAQDGGRGTGYFGTGVYFYTSPDGAKDHRCEGKELENERCSTILEMECPCKRPFIIPDNNDTVWEFHRFSRDMVRAVRWKDSPPPRVYQAIVPLRHNGVKLDYEELQERIDRAVSEVKHCVKQGGWWTPDCTQPINHLLRGLGFDCVYPLGEYGERNDLGAVLFREDLAECMGESYLEGKGDEKQNIHLDDRFKKCVGGVTLTRKV